MNTDFTPQKRVDLIKQSRVALIGSRYLDSQRHLNRLRLAIVDCIQEIETILRDANFTAIDFIDTDKAPANIAGLVSSDGVWYVVPRGNDWLTTKLKCDDPWQDDAMDYDAHIMEKLQQLSINYAKEHGYPYVAEIYQAVVNAVQRMSNKGIPGTEDVY